MSYKQHKKPFSSLRASATHNTANKRNIIQRAAIYHTQGNQYTLPVTMFQNQLSLKHTQCSQITSSKERVFK